MIPYVELNCPDYHSINDGLEEYVYKFTTLTTENPDARYCNFIQNPKHLLEHNPRLDQYFKSLKLVIRDFYFTLSWDFPGLPLHIDKPPVIWKCNWPIINFDHSIMQFWKLKDETQDINQYITRTGDPASKDNDNYMLDIKDFDLTHEYQFNNTPLLMDGTIPHSVRYQSGQQFPRIGIQIMFFKEPLHLI